MASAKEPRISWFLLLLYLAVVVFTESAEGRQTIPKPKSCDKSETWFRHRRRFVYKYVATVEAGFSGTSDVVTGSTLSCDVTVNVPKRCEIKIQLSRCLLKEKGLNGQLSLSPKSKQLAKLLHMHEVYVQMDRGVVLEQRMVVDRQEPVFITNIKRAVVSQLQLPILPSKKYDEPLTLHDQFGDCQMHVSFDAKAKSLRTSRDVTKCSMFNVFGRQRHMMSFAKQFELQFLQGPIKEVVYPFESKLECQYKVVNYRISKSTCHHGQAFKPITFDGELTAATAINVSQSLSLTSSRKMSPKETIVNRFLKGRQFADLMMQVEVAPPQDVTSSRLLQTLDEIIAASSASQSADNMAPEKFRSFVDLARDAESGALEEVMEAVLECREPEGSCVLQEPSSGQAEAAVIRKQRESFYTDGLLSCGTETCVATYLNGVQRGVVSLLEAELSLLNMALFYHPAPAVISNMLALCKSSKTRSRSNCWLSLGTLTGRLAQALPEDQQQQQQQQRGPSISLQEGRDAVTRVLQHFGGMVGDACMPGTGLVRNPSLAQQQMRLASVLLALKSLANAGTAVSWMEDDGGGVRSAVLQCVNNPDLPDSVSTAAMTILNKADLNSAVNATLTTVLGDPSRPVTLRTMAFDRLLRHHDVRTVRHLADVIDGEKLVSLKTYMVTRVGHLLESNLPQGYSLRSSWREVLEKRPLPVLERMEGRGSEFAEFSRYVELPFSKDQLGARLGVEMVFEPSSVVPTRLRAAVSLLLFNHTVNLLDVGVDVQGFENIAREFMAMGGLNAREGPGTVMARLMQAMLLKSGETPTLFLQDMKVAEALKKLIDLVNMPTGDSVQAQVHVKVFGNEVGYMEVQDVIQMVRGHPSMGGAHQSPGVTLAQKLSEGVHYYLSKSSKLVEVVRVFPTAAGLPWRADVQGSLVASGSLNVTGTVAQFLSRQGPLDFTGNVRARMGVRVTCEGSVAIGSFTSSGLRLNISVLVDVGVDGRSRFAPRPGAQMLEMGLGAVKKPFTLVSVRSDIYQLHNGEEMVIQTPSTQMAVERCVPDFVQKWTGQKVCLKGFYQQVPLMMPHHPIPLLSGPLHLDVTAGAVDKSLKEYTATFLLSQRREPSPLIVFDANFSAQGEKMKRNLEMTVRVHPETKEVQGRAQVPEFGLKYALDFNSTLGNHRGSNYQHLLSSILTVGPRVIHSLIVESQNLNTAPAASASEAAAGPVSAGDKSLLPPVTAMLLRVNMSLPGLSLEVLTKSSSNQEPGFFSHGLYVRYFCEPHLGILYTLHGKPKVAAANGHVSLWSFSNHARIRSRQNWRASDTMAVLVPGHNVTLTNTITANSTYAFRATKIYWTSGLGTPNVTTDFITMDAEVRNDSVGLHQNFHYIMRLDHQDKYDVRLDGSLTGPLSNMAFQTDIVYTAKHRRRERRSLRSISNRLKRMEKGVEEAMETIEEMVVRRGAELTDTFLKWLAGEPEQEEGGGNNMTGAAVSASPEKVADGAVQAPSSGAKFAGRWNVDSMLRLFAQPSWKMDIDANLKFKPRMLVGSPKPVGYGLEWDLHVNFPHLQKDLVFFNGTLDRMNSYDVNTDWRLHSDLLNFTLTYFLQQLVDYPRIYHWHQWKVVELTKHRYDRSFSLLVDLERHDHFVYHVHLVSPCTNLTHQIHFSTSAPGLCTLRTNLTLHKENPTFDIRYRESSDLTSKGLVADLSLNSTWLDFVLDMDIDWSTPGALMATQHLNATGKVPFFQGSSQVDVQVKMDQRKVRQKPSLTVQHNSTAGQVTTLFGQLLDKDLVLFTFSSQQPGAKRSVTLLNWHIRLLEPTLLQHSLSWESRMTEPLFRGLYSFYRTGAHTFLLFGETVADNVYRNVSDMAVPFTNMTISQVVDRLVEGRMKRVAMAGLDPQQHVPIVAKVLKGGLNMVQALQLSWQNSHIGRLTYTLGAHRAVSTAAWLSTRLHYMVVQDPPFLLRQYVNFHIMPVIRAARASQQFNFTVPLPFVWRQYLSWPTPRLLTRQRDRCLKIMKSQRAKSDFPFMAILSRDKVQTFDGLNYNIAVPGETNCTYLLGTDTVVKNQSLLLTDGSATLALRLSTVSMGWNGTVHVREGDDHVLSHIPAELVIDHTKVTLTNGQLAVGVEGQMRMTYDPESELYIIEMAGHLHNRSLGLLGTTTRDLGDDLRLPSGQLLADPSGFQEKYELGGQAECRNKPVQQASSSECKDRHAQLCRGLFEEGGASPLAPCFSDVDPRHFLDLCLSRTCQGLPHNPANACPVVSTYVRLCDSRGHHLTPDTQAFKNACDGCSSSRAVDMVLCPALRSADRSPEEARSVLSNLAGHVTRGARFGLVHSPHQHAHAHLFDGQLFVTAKDLEKKLDAMKLTVPGESGEDSESGSSGSGTPSIREILEAASNYPFRAGARRFVVIFTGPSTPVIQNVTWLQQQLWNRSISLIQVSADLDWQRVLSASWDGQVMCRGCRKGRVSLATTETGWLAAETRGMYMSFDALKKGRSARMRKLLRPFKHILSQPSPQCASVVK